MTTGQCSTKPASNPAIHSHDPRVDLSRRRGAWRRAGALRGGLAGQVEYARWATGYGGVPGPEVRSGVRGGRGLSAPAPAAWYCSATLAGMRSRSLTVMPWSFAQARISPERRGWPR